MNFPSTLWLTDQIYPCVLCAAYFRSRRDLDKHNREEHVGERAFPYSVCFYLTGRCEWYEVYTFFLSIEGRVKRKKKLNSVAWLDGEEKGEGHMWETVFSPFPSTCLEFEG